MAVEASVSLLSSSKTASSHLAVQLHPLVILTISDYITRHILRSQTGPIVGAILGAQNGRDVTMEHAFECKLEENKDGDVMLHPAWFHERLQQYRDVHKAPALDLVGWFTLTPPSGPQAQHLPIHNQLLEQYNESVLLLAFHPSSISDGSAKGGKLPLTIYESVYEGSSDGTDRPMPDQGESGPQLVLRFKEQPYSVETGEAEMIGVDFVARGGARAGSSQAAVAAATAGEGTGNKGKKRAAGSDETKVGGPAQAAGVSDFELLSADEEERIAMLTSKANAIRMLRQRVSLLKKYLEAVPACYLNDASTNGISADPAISHPILRSIASLLARLSLVAPSTPTPSSGDGVVAQKDSKQTVYDTLAAAEASDVALVSLLGSLGSMLDAAQNMGTKASIVESTATRAASKGGAFAGQQGGRLQMPMEQDLHRDQGIFMDDEDEDSVMDDVERSALG